MNDLKNVIAKNIAELRKACGYTQLELAEKLNYSDKAVSKWERGEAVPDIAVLKELAELFEVSLDYLVEAKHDEKQEPKQISKGKIHNRGLITGISVLIVWLAATLAFVLIDIIAEELKISWLGFIYAIPVSMVVWLVFNSIWFKRHRNFLIISFLMWSALAALYLSLLLFSFNLWQIFILGIPAQIIIFMWSGLKYKTNKDE